MTTILFDKWVLHFITYVQAHYGNICTTNLHLLVLDGHNSHVTIDVGLDLITLPSHISHAFQPFNVACFKPFKIAFRPYMDVWTLTNKGKGAKKKIWHIEFL
jgi:hypothetical protein